MSKANVVCPNCEKDWLYRGLSCESATCPVCSTKVPLSSEHAEVIDEFGFADDPRKRSVRKPVNPSDGEVSA